LIVDNAIDKIISQQEDLIPILGVSASVSTLVGLFGTVWGLIHSFMSIGEAKSAEISVVAPGIAEALITTLAGLIVAIPSTIFYYYLNAKVRSIEQVLDTLSLRILNAAKRDRLQVNQEKTDQEKDRRKNDQIERTQVSKKNQ